MSPLSSPNSARVGVGARARRGALVVGAIVLLAVVEAASALVAPLRAPSDEDWAGAAAEVRKDFHPNDLIVAAPSWADQVMRLHLGDLVPVAVAGRIDSGRFTRIWEISQGGARADDADGQVIAEHDHGALTLRLIQRQPAAVTHDFVEQWQQAAVMRVGLSPGASSSIECQRLPDRHQCPGIAENFVKPDILEIGNTLRRVLYVQPVAGSAVSVEYASVPMGRQLVVAGGLHHVWFRKNGAGTVNLRVLVDGKELLSRASGNRTGFQIDRVDTAAYAGRTATVRFEITSEQPYSRHFGFAAEARNP